MGSSDFYKVLLVFLFPIDYWADEKPRSVKLFLTVSNYLDFYDAFDFYSFVGWILSTDKESS